MPNDMPTELIAAFRATLEEVLGADILLHVRDIAHDDTAAQKAEVEQVLKRLFDARKPAVQPEPEPFDDAPVLLEMESTPPVIEVHNKIDAWEEIHGARYIPHGEVMAVSAITGAGCDELLERIDRMLAESLLAPAEFVISNSDGKAMAWLYAHGQVLARHESELVSRFTVRLSPANHARYVAEFALTPNHQE